MRLIIEGCDKSGKSTLIEHLKNIFPKAVQLKLMTKPKDNSDEETQKLFDTYMQMYEMTNNDDYVFIFDRYYLSELVYSYIRGNDRLETENGKEYFDNLEENLKENSLIVLLEHPAEKVAERFNTCKEDFVKPEDIKKIQDRYREVINNSKLNSIIIDTVQLGLDNSVELIKEKLNELRGN